jgi:hypothetical protein
LVNVIDGGIAHIPLCGLFNHISYLEALDGFILRDAARAVGATNGLDVSATAAVLTIISSFLGHLDTFFRLYQISTRVGQKKKK